MQALPWQVPWQVSVICCEPTATALAPSVSADKSVDIQSIFWILSNTTLYTPTVIVRGGAFFCGSATRVGKN
jgi:hypothetical protein